jgi:dihydrofolate reductase
VGKVIFDMSASLDGYVVAPGPTPDEPLGKGGEQLHDWALRTGAELPDTRVSELGAMICGRRTYDDSLRWWKADGPTGPARVPLFVVTHQAPDDVPDGGVYTFVTDGIDSALRQAAEVAGDKSVSVMGGPDIGGQFLRAGLLDEIGVHLVPVLFGGGTRFFDAVGEGYVQLEVIDVVDTPAATHLRYRVVR